jgi:hypothetical protein
MKHVGIAQPFDWRVLLNGRIDEWAYERGRIDTSLPFEELRRVSDVTERARRAAGRTDFSSPDPPRSARAPRSVTEPGPKSPPN